MIISIHAPRVGCDALAWATDFGGIRISIHAPRVGCDWTPCKPSWTSTNFNPRTPCGVRPAFLPWIFRIIGISIHAPRVGCDFGATMPPAVLGINFNPRTPCGVRRLALGLQLIGVEFQSTHPVWGATAVHGTPDIAERISIHAPRVGCDPTHSARSTAGKNFNPRTPCGVRHPVGEFGDLTMRISIHAPRVGCDWAMVSSPWYLALNFNPRTPCGVRHTGLLTPNTIGVVFQSTHPVWGATTRSRPSTVRRGKFQSTHPVWGATMCAFLCFRIR